MNTELKKYLGMNMELKKYLEPDYSFHLQNKTKRI